MESLDNPIWSALATRQERLAETCKLARRFPPDVTSLGAFAELPTPEAFQSLACLQKAVAPKEATALFLLEPPELPAGWTMHELVPLDQMVCDKFTRATASAARPVPEFTELTEADVPEMVALAELTKPGPFARRTRELGTYLGIRWQGRLAAMAGERMRLPGYTEVSAVCTHPDFLGLGYAAGLMSELIQQIERRGERAFLHVRSANRRAIELYERLGFRRRLTFQLTVLLKPATSAAPAA